MSSVSDLAIQATSNDASTCKKYAVQKGYWSDPYISHMVRGSGMRKAPEISRGYYARTESVWILLKKFIAKTEQRCQIVSLGAGLDTNFWRLYDEKLTPVRYVELDFSNVTMKKVQTVQSRPPLSEKLTDEENCVKFDSMSIISNRYSLLPVDLRDLKNLEAQLKLAKIDYSLPTLFLAECVLVYMQSRYSNNIIKWIAEKFNDCMFINYEQLNMNDRFGQVMVDNLRSRGCDLPGVDMCDTIDTQHARFISNGWQNVECITMWSAYYLLPQDDRYRVDKLEFMDEVELLEQLMSHYCICCASKDNSDIGLQEIKL